MGSGMRIHVTCGPGSVKTPAAKILTSQVGSPHDSRDATTISPDRIFQRPIGADLLPVRTPQAA
jgi:hypothetical protein